MVATGGRSWPAMSAFMWFCASHHVVKSYERFSARRKLLKKDLAVVVEIVNEARWWILCSLPTRDTFSQEMLFIYSFFFNNYFFSFRSKVQMMRSPPTPEIRVILRVISGPNHHHHHHHALDNPF